MPKQRFVAHPRQTFVDKHLRRRENDAAIDVVLVLQRRGIADAHRTLAEKPGKVGRDAFGKIRTGDDRMNRTQRRF